MRPLATWSGRTKSTDIRQRRSQFARAIAMRVVIAMTTQAIRIARPNDVGRLTSMIVMASRTRRHIFGFRGDVMHGRFVALEARLIERLPLVGIATKQAHQAQ